MLKRLFAIGLLALCAANADADPWWSESYEPTPRVRETESRPPQTQPNSTSAQPEGNQSDADHSAVPVKLLKTGKTAEESAQDAKYQDDQATTNRWMIWLTGILGIGSILLFVSSLIQIRISATTARKQLRAYVGIESNRFSFDSPSLITKHENAKTRAVNAAIAAGGIYTDFMSIGVRNFGETPAYHVTVFAGFAPTNFGERLPDDFFTKQFHAVDAMPTATHRATTAVFTLHRDQTEISKHNIPASALESIKHARSVPPTRQIYVLGRIYYRDIYGQSWRTKFCYSWEPWHPAGERFVAYQEHNEEDQVELAEPPPPK
jgi:hypothetical protein